MQRKVFALTFSQTRLGKDQLIGGGAAPSPLGQLLPRGQSVLINKSW